MLLLLFAVRRWRRGDDENFIDVIVIELEIGILVFNFLVGVHGQRRCSMSILTTLWEERTRKVRR